MYNYEFSSRVIRGESCKLELSLSFVSDSLSRHDKYLMKELRTLSIHFSLLYPFQLPVHGEFSYRRLSLPTMTMRLTVVTAGAFLTAQARAQHYYTDSFPSDDEYDFTILDPNSVFGSPYGGYGRASRSRLAAMPLHFPGIADSEPSEENEFYYELQDEQGRKFVCRSYHEDELDVISVNDSMFNTPIEKPLPSIADNENTLPDEGTPVENPIDAQEELKMEVQPDGTVRALNPKGSIKMVGESLNSGSDDNSGLASSATKVADNGDSSSISDNHYDEDDDKEIMFKGMEHGMSKLNDVCAQYHAGWWSYEWCFGKHLSQFHVHVDGKGKVHLQDVMKLGYYASTNMEVYAEDDHSAYLGDMRKMGFVVDSYDNGDVCDETGKPRTSRVLFQCCDVKQRKNGVLYKGKPVESNIAQIVDIQEPEVCSYDFTVCTPVLCEGASEMYGEDFGIERDPEETTGKYVMNEKKPRNIIKPRKEDESIRETLDRTLGVGCLQSYTTGWWMYKFCYGGKIRQIHEGDTVDPKTGQPARFIETEHVLGGYSEILDSFPDEEEANYVVNHAKGHEGSATADAIGRTEGSRSRTGAYFVQEYTSGDVCDDSDVTESAIKSGNVGEGDVHRETTVRYFCGNGYQLLNVNEDSTCHYIVDVAVQDLCDHPLFKAPIPKKTVVKCLPADDF